MKINVRFLATIKNAAGTSQTTIVVNGNTVGNVIDALVFQYGDKFRDEILHSDGSIKQSIKIVLNGAFIHSNDILQAIVSEGDTLDILTPFYGG